MKDFNEQIKTLKEMIEESHTIAFFTGAGISTLSGIPDFRSKNGLYSNRYHGKKPEKILHIKYFNKHPEEFYAFYREKLLTVKRNMTLITSNRQMASLIVKNVVVSYVPQLRSMENF